VGTDGQIIWGDHHQLAASSRRDDRSSNSVSVPVSYVWHLSSPDLLCSSRLRYTVLTTMLISTISILTYTFSNEAKTTFRNVKRVPGEKFGLPSYSRSIYIYLNTR
jgi:hypothetical protein